MIRFAIYFTPAPDSKLAKAATNWLGRDIYGQKQKKQQLPYGISPERFRTLTASPFHYGFHGTLKPPFRLNPKLSQRQLTDRLKKISDDTTRFNIPEISLKKLGSFLCLMPKKMCPELHSLANRVVADLDEFRMAAEEKELEKRRASGLTNNQEAMLTTWGYPFVMDEFRFHLTLTGKIEDQKEISSVTSFAQSIFHGDMCRDIPVDGLSLFTEKNKKPMTLHSFYAFGK